MKDSEWNEAMKQFVLTKALFSVFVTPTTYFEKILIENE